MAFQIFNLYVKPKFNLPCVKSYDIILNITIAQICDEFYRQGDYERQLNIPVTALCDRYTTTVSKIQTGAIWSRV